MQETLIGRDSSIPWAKLDWDVPREMILNDYANLTESDFVEHRPEDGHKDWFATTLYGYDKSMTKSHWEYRGVKTKAKVTQSGEKCSNTLAWVQSLPFSKINDVRFLVIKPGGQIVPHVDVIDRNWLDPVSIAIQWPQACRFHFTDHGQIPFHPGMAAILNIHYEHYVINESDQPRINLLIHGKKKQEFWQNVIC